MDANGVQNGVRFDQYGFASVGNITHSTSNPPWDVDDDTRYDVWYEDRDNGTPHRTQYRNLALVNAITIANGFRRDDCKRGTLMVDAWIEQKAG